jgi:hypothetical protein
MKPVTIFIILLISITSNTFGQTTSTFVPTKIDTSKSYLFYLHGGIVQEQGANAVSEYFGSYEYQQILDTLSSHGFYVISEVRPKGTGEVEYGEKVARQIDTLLTAGVAPENIALVGASLGAYMTIEAAHKIKNSKIKYALIGLCSDYALELYSKYRDELCGDFLSIYESSDQKGSCETILAEPRCKSGFKEIKLNMGNGHGFLYKPYKEWVHPLVKWIAGQ